MSMMRLEDDCVECGKPCTSSCPMYHPQPHYYCDVCGQEFAWETMYRVCDGADVCGYDLFDYLEKKGIIGRIPDDD